MLTGLTHFLTRPNVSGLITRLEDERSMLPIFVRDFVFDNGGKTLMAYTRDKHDGWREEAITQYGTSVVWGLGVGFLSRLYDKLLPRLTFGSGQVALPWLQLNMLNETTRHWAQQFAQKFPTEASYQNMLKLFDNPALQRLYKFSSVFKFLLVTAVPASLIGFGLTRLNQRITRWFVAERERVAALKARRKKARQFKLQQQQQQLLLQKQVAAAALLQANPAMLQFARPQFVGDMASSVPAVYPFMSYQPGVYQQPASTAYQQPASTAYQPVYATQGGYLPHQATIPTVTPFANPWGLPPGAAISASAPASFSPAFVPITTAAASGGVKFAFPQFGFSIDGLANSLSKLVQNEQHTTWFIDGVISGGRVVESRNRFEAFEWLFKEGTYLFFTYGLQKLLNRGVSRLMDSSLGSLSSIPLKGVVWLHERFKGQNSAETFKNQLQSESFQETARLLHSRDETALLNQIYRYGLENRQDNLLFELGKVMNWIPTLNVAGKKAATETALETALDLSRPIETEALKTGLALLQKAEQLLQKRPEALANLFKRSILSRFTAFMVSNAVCILFLAYLLPKAQFWMTYKLTGKNAFPGTTKY